MKAVRSRRLVLKRETLRTLTDRETQRAAGGKITDPCIPYTEWFRTCWCIELR